MSYADANATPVRLVERGMSFILGAILFAAVIGVLDAKWITWPREHDR